MQTTVVLFVSRDTFLEPLFESLDNLRCDPAKTALLCIVNGEADLFLKVRNWCEVSKYGERLCIQEKPQKQYKIRQFDISGRRKKIAYLHNLAKEYINTEYVFGVEDDTIVPFYALDHLGQYLTDEVGMIEGVEMGRWGVPYIGGWTVDNINDPQQITSIEMGEGLVEIDAGGFYCFLTKAEYYKNHDFKPFDGNGLGPDVDFSLSLRRKGLKNYALFDVECVHKAIDRDIKFGVTIPRRVRMYKKGGQWRQDILK